MRALLDGEAARRRVYELRLARERPLVLHVLVWWLWEVRRLLPVSDLTDFRGPVPRPKSGVGGMGLRKRAPARLEATKAQWEKIREEKLARCRACTNFRVSPPSRIELHHVVFRSQGGDDVAENLVPLHKECHELVHGRHRQSVRRMLTSLTDAEYAYAIEKAGEGFFERCYGLIYERAA